MLLALGIICIAAGLAWWWWTRITDRAFAQGKSLGNLEGYTRYLGSRIGCNLEDEEGLQAFLQAYRDRIATSGLPGSPEIGRTVFRAGPGGQVRKARAGLREVARGGDSNVVRDG